MPEYAEYLGVNITLRLFYWFTIGLKYAVYSGMIFAWAGCLWLLGKSLLSCLERGKNVWMTVLFFAAFSSAAVYLASAIPVRSGYDNDHDFMCLGVKFFDPNLTPLLSFKEISPLFTDAVSDTITGRSLAGVLKKNRFLLLASALVLYGTLRRFRLAKPAAGLACIFFGFNFLTLLNANSFATTMANVFILLVSIFAASEAYAAAKVGARELFWIFSSMLLVLCARYEFLPVNILISGAVLARAVRRGTLKLSGAVITLSAASLLTLGLCAVYANSVAPSGQWSGTPDLFTNLTRNLWTGNLKVIAGGHNFAVLIAVCSLALLAAAGEAFNREKLSRNSAALVLLALWAGYFSCIYGLEGDYPLHFMRHQLYFLMPFVFLLALALDAIADSFRAFNLARKLKYGSAIIAAALYVYLNAKATFSFNNERRTNDIELEFLMRSQSEWKKDCRVFYPVKDSRRRLLEKYFPFGESGRQAGGCLLKYVSPAQIVFKSTPAAGPEYDSLKAGETSSAWKAATFSHAFYTVWPDRETRAPVPVTIGFFPVSNDADGALKEKRAPQ